MADYNLAALSPRDFEHLVQALATKVVAAGVRPFGDGPDHGREATFEGRMDYPSRAQPWDGYLVIQAKFRQRPSGDPKAEGDWAIHQLASELDRFTAEGSTRRAPDYYLFVTNAVLTPVGVTGSKDRALRLLGERAPELGLAGWEIWDYDKLCRLLDGQGEVRRRYAPFVSLGDVIGEMREFMSGLRPDFAEVVSVFLQSQLRADQYAHLDQARASDPAPVRLAQVFVDLRSFPTPQEAAPADEDDPGRLPSGIVAEIVDAGSEVLKRQAGSVSDWDSFAPEPGRFVVVGGPGQGKTTLGQFLCQLYRAAYLAGRERMSPETRHALDAFLAQCGADGIEVPTTRRFPVRVVLERFSAALEAGLARSLASYVAGMISEATDRDCSADDVRRWLGLSPWLLVLDGLDEVPASSNRDQVLRKVDEFWDEVDAADGDVLVVATTRPQGYEEEFAPHLYVHRHLAPLSRARALGYARRLADAQLGDDRTRKAERMRRLEAAASEPAVAQLMGTPLTVTILSALVDRAGAPPRERWRLFERYYDVIYEREARRGTPASAILERLKPDVDAIHHRLGLLLQGEGEGTPRHEVDLPGPRFAALVDARLEEEGFGDDERAGLVRGIVSAALTRLVFLVGVRDGRVGFEIRSLQEFAAAEAILDGSDAQVRARLLRIAPLPYWRNVFLFAAGHCFHSAESLRDTIVQICHDANDREAHPVAGAVRAGSRLAIDLLKEGVARERPRYKRRLAEVAVRVLEGPDPMPGRALAAVYEDSLRGVYEDAVERQMGAWDPRTHTPTWALLWGLAGRQVPWALEAIDRHWPRDPEAGLRILRRADPRLESGLTTDRLREMLGRVPGQRILRFVGRGNTMASTVRPDQWFTALTALGHPKVSVSGDRFLVTLFGEPDEAAHVWSNLRRVRSGITSRLDALAKEGIGTQGWGIVHAGVVFGSAPDPASLAEALWIVADDWELGFAPEPHQAEELPWPLAACLLDARTPGDLRDLAERARAGLLGDLAVWETAEARWTREGVTSADWGGMTDDRWPFDAGVSEVGFPFSAVDRASVAIGDLTEFGRLYNWYRGMPRGRTRAFAADLCLTWLRRVPLHYEDRSHLLPHDWEEILAEAPHAELGTDLLEDVESGGLPFAAWVGILDELGVQPRARQLPLLGEWGPAAALAQEFVAARGRAGLLVLMGWLARGGVAFPVPDAVLEERLDTPGPVGVAALLVRLSGGAWEEETGARLAAAAAAHVQDDPDVAGDVALVLWSHQVPPAQRNAFLLALLYALPGSPREIAVWALVRALGEESSGLAGRDGWRDAGLSGWVP